MYGFVPTQFITHVNSKPTPTLSDFIESIKKCKDGSYVRVKTVSFDLVPAVLAIKTHEHYWPTVEVRFFLSFFFFKTKKNPFNFF